MEKTLGLTVASAGFLVSMIFLAFHLMQPPDAVPLETPLQAFSSGRAMQHLKKIAARPHPIGSPEHTEVREYIVTALAALGFEPEIQTAEVIRSRSPMSPRFATVKNILIRIPGTDNSKALLLMSHYDTVLNAPGATDDGAGVVTLLETLRALKHHGQVRNDLIFLFTDGEEFGLLGAKAFVEQHAWADDVGLVLNFDNSGSGGPVWMFETSEQNGWLIDEFAKAAPHPAANSLSYEIYKRMPNDTDLSIFKDAGIAGLNFAYIDGRPDYHTFNDNVANIDERSIQHHGSYALALTRHLGNLPLVQIKAQDTVYFNALGTWFIHYSQSWVVPFMILAVILYGGIVFGGLRAGQLNFVGIIKGLVAFLLMVSAGPTIVASLFGVIRQFFVDTDWWLLYYNNQPLLLGFSLLTIAATTVLFTWFRGGVRRLHSAIFGLSLLLLVYFGGLLSWQLVIGIAAAAAVLSFLFRRGVAAWDLYMGALLGLLAITVGVSLWIPGGSFMVTWPLIFALIASGILFLTNQTEFGSLKVLVIVSVFAIPGILWGTQLSYLLYIAMGINLVSLPMVGITLLMGLLIPHMLYLTSWNKWGTVGAVGILGLFLILHVTLGSEFNTRFSKPNTLFYAYNGDSDQAFWASTDQELDAWTAQYFASNPDSASVSEIFPTFSAPMYKSPAPRVEIATPEVKVLKDVTVDDERTLQLRITSARGAPFLNLFFPPESQIVEGSVNGMQVAGIGNLSEGMLNNWWRWRYYGLPESGIELILKVRPSDAFELKLVEISLELPEFSDGSFIARPDNMIPRQYTLSDATVAMKTVIIDTPPTHTGK